jgi:hypothetical protein
MVHLRHPLPAESVELLNGRLRVEMLDVERQRSSWRFRTSRGTCQASLAVVPFGAESAGGGEVTAQTTDDDEIAAITRALGYRPAASLQFDNFCGSDLTGHRELAKFAASVALEYLGVIDVGDLDITEWMPDVTDDVRLPTGRRLLAPRTFLRWCDHESFHLEK